MLPTDPSRRPMFSDPNNVLFSSGMNLCDSRVHLKIDISHDGWFSSSGCNFGYMPCCTTKTGRCWWLPKKHIRISGFAPTPSLSYGFLPLNPLPSHVFIISSWRDFMPALLQRSPTPGGIRATGWSIVHTNVQWLDVKSTRGILEPPALIRWWPHICRLP